MNDAEFRQLQDRCSAILDDWKDPLGLCHYDVAVSFDISGTHFSEGGRSSAGMMVQTDWQYRQARILVNVPACEGIDTDELERMLVHELMHVFVAPLSSERKRDLEELVVTMLADAVRWVRERGRGDALMARTKTKAKPKSKPKPKTEPKTKAR